MSINGPSMLTEVQTIFRVLKTIFRVILDEKSMNVVYTFQTYCLGGKLEGNNEKRSVIHLLGPTMLTNV